MAVEYDELSRRLGMPAEHVDSLFAIAGIDSPETNPSASLARLSHFLAKKLLPLVQTEMERIRHVVVLKERLAALEQRHQREFGIYPVLPDFMPVERKLELMHAAFRLGQPNDDLWSALRRMYMEVFFAPPPRLDAGELEVWVTKVLTAIDQRRPIKDEAGVEYVNSTFFQGENAAGGSG
jgi:hypothetical protein